MKQETMNKLTEALGSAGFELVSMEEETYRHLLKAGHMDAFNAFYESNRVLSIDTATGIISLEIKKV
jgi:hypothetical protein